MGDIAVKQSTTILSSGENLIHGKQENKKKKGKQARINEALLKT